MKIRLNGEIREARISQDNPPRFQWQLRVFNEDGLIETVFETRQQLEESGLQIVQNTNGEDHALGLAGFRPPFLKD